MSSAAEHSPFHISVEQYLSTRYHPDREYIDGVLKEKAMPTKLHGFVQTMIGRWFGNHMEVWGVAPESEVRTQVRSSSFRLPDVNVVPLKDNGTGRKTHRRSSPSRSGPTTTDTRISGPARTTYKPWVLNTSG